MSAQKILIDTDPGDDIDDILAIAFALLRPELDVKSITTVANDTDARAAIIGKLLSLTGRTEIPYAAGMKMPLRPSDAQGRERWLAIEGERINHYAWIQPEDELPEPEPDAVSLMARVIRENPGEIVLVGIGPLTNIATLLCRHPDVGEKLKAIAIMGGEVEIERREHNINVDIAAAEIVFTFGVPIFMGSWDVTRRFVLSPEDCDFIAENGGALGRGLKECIDLWWPWKAHKPGPVMYDVAPIIWSYAPRYYKTTPLHVKIETEGEARGRTIALPGPPNAEVTTMMLADEVRELYLETLCPRA